MSIVIKTKRVVKDCECCYEVMNIKALQHHQLPKPYKKEGHVFLQVDDRGKQLFYVDEVGDGHELFRVGYVYSQPYISDTIKLIRECGQRLSLCNRRQKQLELYWSGFNTFFI